MIGTAWDSVTANPSVVIWQIWAIVVLIYLVGRWYCRPEHFFFVLQWFAFSWTCVVIICNIDNGTRANLSLTSEL